MDTKEFLKSYSPVLKVKSGELSAVAELSVESKSYLYPLLEIMPIPWDWAHDMPSKSIDDHLNGTIEQIAKQIGTIPYMLDLPYIDDEDVLENGTHPFDFLCSEAVKHTPAMVPVTGLGRVDAYNNSVASILTKLNTGLALRLRVEDFEDDDISTTINALLLKLKIKEEDVDLVIDIGSLPQQGFIQYIVSTISFINMFPNIKQWRRLIFIASSFPESLGDIPPETNMTIARGEWIIWKSIIKKGKANRCPSFGDYTVVHPQPFDMDPRQMRLGTKIKYTINDDWYVVKGRSVKKGGYAQFYDLANIILTSSHYCGENFSFGDKYIKDCVARVARTGNQTTWVKVAVNHHIEYVVQQLANFCDF